MTNPATTPRTRRDCTCPQATHTHGTYQMYQADKCRCRPCTTAQAAYAQHRRRNIAYGRWGTNWTEATPIREHINQLRAAGLGADTIADRAGVSRGVITRILWPDRARGHPPTSRLRADTAAKILAVRPTLDTLEPGAMIDATGTRRRLQALYATGWNWGALANHIAHTENRPGYPNQVLSALVNQRQRLVTAEMARRVRRIYDELWDQTPPTPTKYHLAGVTKAIRTAEKRGWARPIQWDDHDLDNPAARPHTDAGPRRLIHLDTIDELLTAEPGMTSRELAERLQVSKSAVWHAAKRAGRVDITERLSRNAAAAGRPGRPNLAKSSKENAHAC